MIWPADAQLAYITEQMRKRMAARVLLKDRDECRHEKAVDRPYGGSGNYNTYVLVYEPAFYKAA